VNNNDDSIHDQSALVIDSNNSKSIESTTGIQPAANAKTGDAKQADITKSPERRKPAAGEKKFNGKFAVNISAGPDVSGVSMSRIGRIDLNYGIGFSYALSKRFSLRAGFYVSDKIYSADTTEYKIPYGNNADYLSGIYANCIVYDIPLTVSYTFPKVGNHDWLVSAGLSSYLMKKETYDYLYKYPSGYTDEKKWAIYNQNHHYLSVLDISAGYEYIFSKRTSLIAEPYVQLPLSGVGAGKVKLNSGGILFTVRIKPF
ncbi:MAG TPA: hypothetical protein VG847_06260, partial [Chitinophagaceae bacterium]|nr:hypothetical protein [Chitinophagaceae bacterium]